MKGIVAAFVAACGWAGLAHAGDARPDLPPYEAFVAEQMKLIGGGSAEEAARLAEKQGRETFTPAKLEMVKKQFAQVYGGGGEFHGFDVAGVRRLGPRLAYVYAVAHYEHAPVIFVYKYRKLDTWFLTGMALSTNLDELVNEVPLEPVR